jgi:hypothetical protein
VRSVAHRRTVPFKPKGAPPGSRPIGVNFSKHITRSHGRSSNPNQHRAHRGTEYTERNSGHKSPRAPQPQRAPWATRAFPPGYAQCCGSHKPHPQKRPFAVPFESPFESQGRQGRQGKQGKPFEAQGKRVRNPTVGRLGLIFPSTSLARTDDLQTQIQHRAHRDAKYTERNSGHKSPRAPQLLLLRRAPSRRLRAPWATRAFLPGSAQCCGSHKPHPQKRPFAAPFESPFESQGKQGKPFEAQGKRVRNRRIIQGGYRRCNKRYKSPRAPQLQRAPWATRRPVRVTPKFHARPQLRGRNRELIRSARIHYSVGVKRALRRDSSRTEKRAARRLRAP